MLSFVVFSGACAVDFLGIERPFHCLFFFFWRPVVVFFIKNSEPSRTAPNRSETFHQKHLSQKKKKVELQKFAESEACELNPESVIVSAKLVITKKGTVECLKPKPDKLQATPPTVTLCVLVHRGCQLPGA